MLQQLPNEIGTRLGETTVNAAAFADDLLLFAAMPARLQELIDTVTTYIKNCGMTINTMKSMSVSIVASPYLKKTAVDAQVCRGIATGSR